MLRGAVLHCQFEREAKGGPPQRVGGSMPNTKHSPTLGFSGMSRVVLSVQFLRTKALLSLDHGAAGGAVWYRTNSAAIAIQWYVLVYVLAILHRSSSVVAEFDTAEWIN